MRVVVSWLLVILIVFAIGWMANASFARLQQKKERAISLSTFPKLNLLSLDSLGFRLESLPLEPVVLIHFNSGCDHCQYEAAAIKASINKFKGAQLVFFSTEPITVIRQFSEQHGLSEYVNIHLTKINAADVTATLGTLAVPHLFIYGADRKLLKEFRGETKPEAILKYLQ
ncbi:MAG TPA: redoxin domain-containing protein [Cyclobacteriaceae bacterium]|nr:redoxin domain-containing protein [Cyclobacteriaceae bacterium]HRJ82709.1 redoxin domain-containing protein [Cyclobacteriaceae bacterium]